MYPLYTVRVIATLGRLQLLHRTVVHRGVGYLFRAPTNALPSNDPYDGKVAHPLKILLSYSVHC
jgi:hypothetical protein